MIYTQQKLSHNKIRRVFNESVETDELKWHKDQYDRIVFVESGNGWKLQMDEELPQTLQEGQKYFIPKETYHRVIKGTGDLQIVIIEDNGLTRVPIKVINQMKKGLIYSRKNKNLNYFTEGIITRGTVTKDEIQKIKRFFDSQKNHITLNESFKGKPENDSKYVEWLSYGGDLGYKWIITNQC